VKGSVAGARSLVYFATAGLLFLSYQVLRAYQVPDVLRILSVLPAIWLGGVIGLFAYRVDISLEESGVKIRRSCGLRGTQRVAYSRIARVVIEHVTAVFPDASTTQDWPGARHRGYGGAPRNGFPRARRARASVSRAGGASKRWWGGCYVGLRRRELALL